MHSLIDVHWLICKSIWHYLLSTSSFGLHLAHQKDLFLNRFSDSKQDGSVDNRKSTNGYTIFLDHNVISRNLANNIMLLTFPFYRS
jgi:hypothetical protein